MDRWGGRTREQVPGRSGSQAPRSLLYTSVVKCESIFLALNWGCLDLVILRGPANPLKRKKDSPSRLAHPEDGVLRWASGCYVFGPHTVSENWANV